MLIIKLLRIWNTSDQPQQPNHDAVESCENNKHAITAENFSSRLTGDNHGPTECYWSVVKDPSILATPESAWIGKDVLETRLRATRLTRQGAAPVTAWWLQHSG